MLSQDDDEDDEFSSSDESNILAANNAERQKYSSAIFYSSLRKLLSDVWDDPYVLPGVAGSLKFLETFVERQAPLSMDEVNPQLIQALQRVAKRWNSGVRPHYAVSVVSNGSTIRQIIDWLNRTLHEQFETNDSLFHRKGSSMPILSRKRAHGEGEKEFNLVCRLCQHQLTAAGGDARKMVPCGHVACRQCVNKLRRPGEVAKCPFCRASFFETEPISQYDVENDLFDEEAKAAALRRMRRRK
jgi:hypothetical protein